MSGSGPEVPVPPTLPERLLYAVVRSALALWCRLYWRLDIHGVEHVPRSGPYVVCAVHRSNVDSPLVAALTRRRLRFMGKDGLWQYRPVGWFFTAMGGIPVHRGEPDRAALRSCEQAIRGGEPVVIFPEGGRRSGPVLDELFDGPAFVAARTGVPIVPVGIGGSAEANPPGKWWLRPAKIVMVVGSPIPAPTTEAGTRLSRRQVREHTELLRARLQPLFDQARSLADAHTRSGSGPGPAQ